MTILVLAVLCAAFSCLSYLVSWSLSRFAPGVRDARRVQISGALPTVLYLAALAIWHLLWLQAPEGYSPLVIFIYGWWFVYPFIALNLAVNCIAARLVRHKL